MHVKYALTIGLGAFIGSGAYGQVNFNGNYSQDFNGLAQSGSTTMAGRGPHALDGVLGSTGMTGWYGHKFFGSSVNTELRAQDGSLGSSSGRGVVFFGQNGSSDRALGYLPTSNQSGGFGVVLINASSDTYDSLDISYIGEQWRAGGPNVLNSLTFYCGVGESLENATTYHGALDFNTPFLGGGEIAVDGNIFAFRTQINGVISGLNWAPGQSIVLRWDHSDLSGQDNGLAIDDLMITGIMPAPGALAPLAIASVVGGRRRRVHASAGSL